jgi:hypothetical protein
MMKEKNNDSRRRRRKSRNNMDIYNEEQLEEMLENDEITEAEYSFMLGKEEFDKTKKKQGERRKHEDTQSVDC